MTTTISYTENVEEITIAYTESGDVNIIKFNEQARGPVGATGATGADGAPGGLREVKSSSFTAANDTAYTAVASLTVTDPTPVQGKGFSLFVRNGTATIGGTAYSTAGTIIERIYHSGAWSNNVYRSAGNILSADISDATNAATPDKIVKRDADGGASFASPNDGVYATTTTGNAVRGVASGNGTGVKGICDSSGIGLYGYSFSGFGLSAFTDAGTYHAEFGTDGSNRSFIARILGAFGWWRGAYKGLIQADATLTADRTWNLPDASGTIALTSDLAGYQTTAGTLALGGFSSITGTLAIANVAAETATRLATAFNAGTEDTAAGDTDRLAVISPAGGWMSLTTLWTWITGKADSRYARASQLVESTAQIDATGTTQADVTGMTGVTLLANTWYRLEFAGQVTTTAGASWQIEMATTQNLSRTSGVLPSINNSGNTAAGQLSFQTASRLIIAQRSTTGTAVANTAIALFKTGSNAPTVKITFAQWTAPAGTASLLPGAVAVFTKVP